MSKLMLPAAVLLAMVAPVQAETYTVEHWPGDIDTIPCSAWERTADGAWALKGYVKVGSSVIENVGFKGDSTARLLAKKCGAK